jgi:hypothetical protein
MKRIISSLFTIALTFVFACSSHSIKHLSIAPADPTLKTVAIIVADGSDTDPVISVVPDPIKIKINDKIKWVVYNNRGDGSVNVKIDTFIIDGTTTPESPFKSGKTYFDLTGVASGSTASYPAGDETTAARQNTYKYTIHATVTLPSGTVKTLKDLDPRVVISGG